MEAFQFNVGLSVMPVAPLAGDTRTGATAAEGTALTKAFNRLKAFTLPMPVAKSHPGVAA